MGVVGAVVIVAVVADLEAEALEGHGDVGKVLASGAAWVLLSVAVCVVKCAC